MGRGSRAVTTDGIAQRKAIDRVYSHVAAGSQAQAFISEFYRNDPPQKRAQSETVSVEVKSVLPTSDANARSRVGGDGARDLYGASKEPGPLEGRIHDCRSTSQRTNAPLASIRWDLCNERELGQSSVIQERSHHAFRKIGLFIIVLTVGGSAQQSAR